MTGIFVVPAEGEGFLRVLDQYAREHPGESVPDAFADGRLSYMGGGASAEIFPSEGLDLVIDRVVRNKVSKNFLPGSGYTDPTISTVSGNGTQPISITTGSAHGLTTGDRVKLASIGGNTNANGTWSITRTGSTTFTLDNSPAGNANYTSGGTIQVLADNANQHHIGLFTSPTGGSSVPTRDATLTGSGSGAFTTGTTPVVEATGTDYARAAINDSSWPAPVDESTSGRKSVVASGISFSPSGGSWGTIWGFFIATTNASTAQNTGIALFYATFDDNQSIAVNTSGYTVRVAPFIRFDH